MSLESTLMVTNEEAVTVALPPIFDVLRLIEGQVKSSGMWHARSDDQARFLEEYYYPGRTQFLQRSGRGDPLRVASIVSENADDINTFLRRHGFNINLGSFPPSPLPRFGAASVIDVVVRWPSRGTPQNLMAADKKTYPGVKIGNADVFGVDQQEPMVILPTNVSDYEVGMIIPNEPVRNPFDLIDFVQARQREIKNFRQRFDRLINGYQHVIFPIVSLNQEPDVGWFEGMSTTGVFGSAAIERALQQTTFEMGLSGATARSAFASRVVRLGRLGRQPDRPYSIDRPFVCWIQKEGVPLPVFAAYIPFASWKEPKRAKFFRELAMV